MRLVLLRTGCQEFPSTVVMTIALGCVSQFSLTTVPSRWKVSVARALVVTRGGRRDAIQFRSGVAAGPLVDDFRQSRDFVERLRVAGCDVLRDRIHGPASSPGDPDPPLVLAGPDLRQRLVAERDR